MATYSPSIFDRLCAAIERIPTVPRRPERLRGVVVASVLPVVIWLFQHSLQHWLP